MLRRLVSMRRTLTRASTRFSTKAAQIGRASRENLHLRTPERAPSRFLVRPPLRAPRATARSSGPLQSCEIIASADAIELPSFDARPLTLPGLSSCCDPKPCGSSRRTLTKGERSRRRKRRWTARGPSGNRLEPALDGRRIQAGGRLHHAERGPPSTLHLGGSSR